MTAAEAPTVVRMTETLADYDLIAGETYPHEGYDAESGWPVLTTPAGLELTIDPLACEIVEVTPTADLHVITERADGPDLDDLVRLIRYLREHDLPVEIGYPALAQNLAVAHRATWKDRDHHWLFTEGVQNKGAYFVGPDGTVYDCNGEAL